MSYTFTWCNTQGGATPDHHGCPGTIGGPDGLVCNCWCHLEGNERG